MLLLREVWDEKFVAVPAINGIDVAVAVTIVDANVATTGGDDGPEKPSTFLNSAALATVREALLLAATFSAVAAAAVASAFMRFSLT